MKHAIPASDRPAGRLEEEIPSCFLPAIRTTFICENCDYRWDKDIVTAVEDSYSDGQELKRSETRISCPLCGSHEINPYEE